MSQPSASDFHSGDPFLLSLKTNLLYDALLVPNIGLEFIFDHTWSLQLDWMYSRWRSDRIHWYWMTYGGGLEFRYYFQNRKHYPHLQGHHIGLYGNMFTYDFAVHGKGYLADQDHWNYAAGISYGYSLPIARKLNLDFTLGIGYHGGIYQQYIADDDCYVWQATRERRFFGPTKLEISLVWIIDFKSVKKKEEGRR